MSPVDLFEAIHSQRAIRNFKPDPVSEESVREMLDAAIRAPSGGNRQPWLFLVIRDPDLKRQIGAFYKRAFDEAYGPTTQQDTLQTPVRLSATRLSEHMAEVPVLIMACVQHDGSPSTMTRGSSIYPAVQNLMLAARALGLGTVITTLHKRYEEQVKGLLGIPDNVETAALIPLGYPDGGDHFGGSRRLPVEEVTFRDRWGQKGL